MKTYGSMRFWRNVGYYAPPVSALLVFVALWEVYTRTF